MKVRIREGNDFDVVWAITRAGQPEDLSTAINMKLTLVVYGLVIEHNLFTVTDNMLYINIPKEVVTTKGDYRLVFEYTLPDAGQPDGDLKCKTDVVPFRIVPFSADADDVYTVNTSSDVLLGFKGDKGDDGDDAYQIWLDLGNVGTYEDFIAYMRQPAVDAGDSISELEGEIQVSEGLRVQAESERDLAEGVRLSNEQSRVDAEALRVSGEVARNTAEGIRVGDENTRIENEGIRLLAEEDRVDAEEGRVDAEETRVENEALRISAELLREGAESDREDAEQLRQTNTSTAIQNANEATQNANSAAELANTKAEEANTATIKADNARLAIEGDLALKANHGYSSNPKTLKQVDDSLVQLAGEVNLKELKANKQNSLAVDGTGTKFPTVDAVNAKIGAMSGELIADYTHTSNKEVHISSIDYATNTFTSVGHGLSNSTNYLTTLMLAINRNELIYPYNVMPFANLEGYPQSQGFWVINATPDTFQLSFTNGGSPITLLDKAETDLTKWHFEYNAAASIIITGLLGKINRGCRAVIDGSFCRFGSSYIGCTWGGLTYYRGVGAAVQGAGYSNWNTSEIPIPSFGGVVVHTDYYTPSGHRKLLDVALYSYTPTLNRIAFLQKVQNNISPVAIPDANKTTFKIDAGAMITNGTNIKLYSI